MQKLLQILRDQAGATSLEWALLLFAIGLPAYYIVRMTLEILLAHYRLMTTLNALPFP